MTFIFLRSLSVVPPPNTSPAHPPAPQTLTQRPLPKHNHSRVSMVGQRPRSPESASSGRPNITHYLKGSPQTSAISTYLQHKIPLAVSQRPIPLSKAFRLRHPAPSRAPCSRAHDPPVPTYQAARPTIANATLSPPLHRDPSPPPTPTSPSRDSDNFPPTRRRGWPPSPVPRLDSQAPAFCSSGLLPEAGPSDRANPHHNTPTTES
jgi:hypothetical protein